MNVVHRNTLSIDIVGHTTYRRVFLLETRVRRAEDNARAIDLLAYPTLGVRHLLIVHRQPYELVIEPDVVVRFLASSASPSPGPCLRPLRIRTHTRGHRESLWLDAVSNP